MPVGKSYVNRRKAVMNINGYAQETTAIEVMEAVGRWTDTYLLIGGRARAALAASLEIPLKGDEVDTDTLWGLDEDWNVAMHVDAGWDPYSAYFRSRDLSINEVVLASSSVIATKECINSFVERKITLREHSLRAHARGLRLAARYGFALERVDPRGLVTVSGLFPLMTQMKKAESEGILQEMIEHMDIHYGKGLTRKLVESFRSGSPEEWEDLPQWAPFYADCTDWFFDNRSIEEEEFWARESGWYHDEPWWEGRYEQLSEWDSPTQTMWLDQEVRNKRARSVSRAIRRARRN